jgi:hypothetical protein
MATRRFSHLKSGIFANVFLFGVLVSAAPAAFMDLGTSGWQYDAPAGVTIPAPTTSGSTTTFTLQKNPWGSEVVEIVFRTKPAMGTEPAVTQIEHFFMMNFDVTTSVGWGGFQVELIDKFDAVGPPPQGASSEQITHPIWAHIHPNHSVGGGPFYDPFTFRNPSTTLGVDKLTLSNGFIPAGSVWLGSRFRLHDVATRGYEDPPVAQAMEFKLILTPIPIPEPNSLSLMLGGIGVFVGYRWRNRP